MIDARTELLEGLEERLLSQTRFPITLREMP
jgi:hypothetical protein